MTFDLWSDQITGKFLQFIIIIIFMNYLTPNCHIPILNTFTIIFTMHDSFFHITWHKLYKSFENAWNSCMFFGSEECIVHSKALSQNTSGWPLRCIVYNYYDDMIYCYYWCWITIYKGKTITFLNLIYFWSSTKGDFQSCQIKLTLWQKTILKQY